MKMILAVMVLGLAACGGTQELFKGDQVVAELRDNVPFCSQGASGPAILERDLVGTDPAGESYVTRVMTCEWECGRLGDAAPMAVIATFIKSGDRWSVDVATNPDMTYCSATKDTESK